MIVLENPILYLVSQVSLSFPLLPNFTKNHTKFQISHTNKQKTTLIRHIIHHRESKCDVEFTTQRYHTSQSDQDLWLFEGDWWLNWDDDALQAARLCKLRQAPGICFLEMDLQERFYTEDTKSLNTIVLKHNEMLLAHTSDIKRLNEKITAECKEFHENYKQKVIQLEAENKLVEQREDELKKAEVEPKNLQRKIVKEKSKLEFNKRARELVSSCKQLDNECYPSRKEAEDRKRELCELHKRTMELEDQVKVQNESLQRARMEFETALQISEDEEGMDLDEKLKKLQSELEENREQLQELKNWEKALTSAFNVKNDELQDARLELIDGMKTNHKRRIGVKTLDVGNGNMKCPRREVQQLWHNKEQREASVIECIAYIMKKWKAERD